MVGRFMSRFLERLGTGTVIFLDWVLIVAVFPFVILGFANWAGTPAVWAALIVAGVGYVAKRFRPFPVPMISTPRRARATCLIALVVAVPTLVIGVERDELKELKQTDVPAYLQKLREYQGDERWLLAVKKLTPDVYVETLEQYEAEKSNEARLAADRKAKEERLAKEAEERRQHDAQISELTRAAVDSASTGKMMHADSFPTSWTLIPEQGVLRCELGPVYNNKPRPLVLFKAKEKTYALNGAALGTGKYLDGRRLIKNGNMQTINDLILIGVAMCDKLAQSQCGDELNAFTSAQLAVQRRIKNPDSADVSMLHARTTMTSCGVWLVQSHVDAENGFGAEIRTNFTAKMTRRPDGQWEAQVVFKN